jgi:hypothetical protein
MSSQRVVVSARRAQVLNVSAIRMKHDRSELRGPVGAKDIKILQPFNRSVLERTLPITNLPKKPLVINARPSKPDSPLKGPKKHVLDIFTPIKMPLKNQSDTPKADHERKQI